MVSISPDSVGVSQLVRFARQSARRRVCSLTGCGVGRNRRPLRDAGLELASNPRPTDLDRQSRPTIQTVKLEERQQVFRAIRGPRREEAMLRKSQWPATMGCHEPLVTNRSPPPSNDCDKRLADNGAFMPTDFIASPLHRLVLRPLNCRRRSVALLTLP